jgi:phenylalanyl-tRNA synthetase beta chain
MLASHRWLMQLTGLTGLQPDEVARRLTAAGLEVEARHAHGEGLQDVVVAEVRAIKPHPQRDKLRLVRVFDGQSEHEVVCGAPNVPTAGGRVALARLGAKLPNGMAIEERKLGGVVSRGMICSEVELGIGVEADGILVLAAELAPGQPLVDALELRDTIYEIGLTPNRPDCLGHVGIARELCALFGKPFELSPPPVAANLAAPGSAIPDGPHAFTLLEGSGLELPAALEPIRVEIEAPDRCARYGAALVRDVQIGPSPFALRYRLHTLGLRPISNVVDATHLILLGWGQPIHAFDLAKLRGSRIVVRLANAGERLQTLDGQERSLTRDDLLICDGEGPVALAGVMGGANSEIGPATRDVLIECAYFDPRSVRRTSKRTGLHTDASHRFERGADPRAVRPVLMDAASLIAALGGGRPVARALDVQARAIEPKRVAFRPERAQRLLGRPVRAEDARPIFERLGCSIETHGDGLLVTLPTFRPDLSREVDLIEEFARVTGYDTIPTELPLLRPNAQASGVEIRFVRRMREVAVAQGLLEAVNYAFLAPATLEKARAGGAPIRLANPMSEERSLLRTAVLPGLLSNLQSARRHQQRRFAGFELGRVFDADGSSPLPRERYQFAALLWGLRQSWYEEREEFDFYDAKGVLESLTHGLIGAPAEARLDPGLAEDAPFLHPKRAARAMWAAQAVGVLGEVHPDVVRAFDLSGRPVALILEIGPLLAAAGARSRPVASSLPRYPAATRDLAVVVPEAVPAGDVANVLREVAGSVAESVRLFDIYRGAPVPDGHKSLAFHVVYRDPSATLTDQRVDEVHGRVTAQTEARFGGALRK